MLPTQISQKLGKKKSKTEEKKKVVVQDTPAEQVEDDEETVEIPLHGLSSDDEDSSDDDDDGLGEDAPAIDVSKLPTIAKDDATVKRKLDKAKAKRSSVCCPFSPPFYDPNIVVARGARSNIPRSDTSWFL